MKKLSTLALLSVLTTTSALASVVVIGHPAGVDNLNAEMLERLYMGKTAQVNGATMKLFELKEGASERAAFHRSTTGRNDAQLQSNWSRLVFTGKAEAPTIKNDDAAMIDAIASTPNAIGYVNESAVTPAVKVLLKL
ncbi:MAG: phosphate ABC transporter substrate-binding protein [Ferrimonas sp.]